jgi:predicted dehydrogenase
VCTVNKFLAPISAAALQADKHVLCEKPFGRNGQEAAAITAAASRHGCTLKVGFNLRFHPAVREAHRICLSGNIGQLQFVRGIYGHGGRPGLADEWRGDPDLAGGGELLDQGVHLLDLAKWFLGDIEQATAVTERYFWDISPLEDNAFLVLRSTGGRVASLHTSWTQWLNRFSFEVYGNDGFVAISGLGGSYGPETLTVGFRNPDSSPPSQTFTVFEEPDPSWDADWLDFIDSIELGRSPEVDGRGGLEIMRLVDELYAKAESADRPPERQPQRVALR